MLPSHSTSPIKHFRKRISESDIPHKRINLDDVYIIQRLQRRLDLSLIRLDIHYEHKRIVLLDLLHCALCIERVDKDRMVVEPRFMRNRFARVFRIPRLFEGLWSVKGGCEADFSSLLGVDLKK